MAGGRIPVVLATVLATVLLAFSLLLGPGLRAAQALDARAGVAPSATTAPASPPMPKAWILVDATSGIVLDAGNDRAPLPPASLTKLLTAVVAAQTLGATDSVLVSARAAGEPARKIGMKAGEVWPFRDMLYALLLSSANDAAAAIGERIGGSLENFATIMSVAGQHLGLADSPVLQDPAGLDDNFSVAGGNLLSARDVAIIARAALAQPEVASAVATPIYRFTGPDGASHRLTNHIFQFLTTYPGAIGLKPGFTQKAGNGLALAARRDGRTFIAVVLDAPDPSASAIGLLDRGFAMPPGGPGTGDVLPPVSLPDGPAAEAALAAGSGGAGRPAGAGVGAPAVSADRPASRHHRATSGPGTAVIVVLLLLPIGLAVVLRRRQVKRRRARRLATRQLLATRSRPARHSRPATRSARQDGGAVRQDGGAVRLDQSRYDDRLGRSPQRRSAPR